MGQCSQKNEGGVILDKVMYLFLRSWTLPFVISIMVRQRDGTLRYENCFYILRQKEPADIAPSHHSVVRLAKTLKTRIRSKHKIHDIRNTKMKKKTGYQ